MEKEYRRKSKVDGFLVVGFILLVIYSISFLTPLLWSLLTSFKEEIDFMNNKISFPKSIDFQNYFTAFKNIKVPIVENGIPYQINSIEMLYNSLVYTVLCTFTHTLVPCLTAYAVAKMEVKFGKVIYSIVIITMILPIIGNLASEIQVSKALGFFDNMFGLAIMKGHFLGTNFLIFHASFKSIAKDYSEAAYIDGASELKVLTKVQLPLIKTTISAIALLSFISFWNDYTTPMVYLPTRPTIAYGLYYFNQTTTNESNFVTVRIAGCMLVTIPVFLIFLSTRKKLIGNLTVGGIKG
ncbi:MAG TPA: carbohydrate ABC transporter permease [Acholeplasmataceae bacterium]|jgi:ABC-type glycerol-3-phosphate transport system permease component|nr:carbohydrate ABC transporter permease [Acholeplasmataceae bacterium]